MAFIPRPMQRKVLEYTSGKMGVSAVPGSGKTQILSSLAAKLIAEDFIGDDQEILIVTLVNSAVDNFNNRVTDLVKREGLLAHLGYRVRTLHGLANDILRERPSLVGLADNFQIVDEHDATEILESAVMIWVRSNPSIIEAYLSSDLENNRIESIRRKQWPDLMSKIAYAVIRQAKDLQVTPQKLDELTKDIPDLDPLLKMGIEVYGDYQRGLNYRGGVDYDDLIRLALDALHLDPDYLQRLQYQWPYILEDEAQDSSRLQEEILRCLVGKNGNWVRVGDPNQAIYETFTTASPQYLRSFLKETGVTARELPDSGRSTRSIIDLANYLVEWTRESHPVEELQDALAPTYIQPTSPNDPQPNPVDEPEKVYLHKTTITAQAELDLVAKSVGTWVKENPEKTVAVLVPRNDRGSELVEQLKKRDIPYKEILHSSQSTRQTAGILADILECLAIPNSSAKLSILYPNWHLFYDQEEETDQSVDQAQKFIKKSLKVENFLWPEPGEDLLESGAVVDLSSQAVYNLGVFREYLRRWQGAVLLPIDQLVLTISQDLFTKPVDLALAHKLAVVLKGESISHPDWGLADLAAQLNLIASNERKFLGFTGEDTGFNPDDYKGQVVVSTIHKAKGLEWDRVYLLSVNNYDFPSAQPQDSYISEPWYIQDHINLEAEVVDKLLSLVNGDIVRLNDQGKEATLKSRLDYSAERLRLLYVGITRARKELIITWNTGRRGESQPAIPLVALWTYWEQKVI